MASNPHSVGTDEECRQSLPEEISADEHGTISLAFRDERIAESEGVEMPARED